MNYAFLLLPFVTAFISWLMIKAVVRSLFRPYKPVNIFGFTWQGALPKNQAAMAASAAKAISREMLNASFITDKLTGPETLEKAMPAIEAHIDNFLNYKLKEAIPVISMFVGEKITNQLKTLFLEELKALFPSIMSQFIGNLSQSGELEKEIAVKLHSVPVKQTEALFYKTFGKTLIQTEAFFAVGGLLAGIVQLLLTLILM